MTTRRLAEAIEYSQPVLYSHFPGGKAEIMNAVALEGFAELAEAASEADGDMPGRARMRAVLAGYLDFAVANPAVYAAMFELPISATFGSGSSETELRAAFDRIVAVLRDHAEPPRDVETVAELFWSALHGIATLERADRLRDAAHERRIDELVDLFGG